MYLDVCICIELYFLCVCLHGHFYKQLGLTQTPQDSLCCSVIICIMFYFRETVNIIVQ